MKLGIFLPNASNGYIISKAAPVFSPTFKHNLEISKIAEDLGFEFVLSMIKYRGFGGETGYWDACLDSFTLTGALASATRHIRMMTTIGALAVHPAIVARALSTLDDISGGRVGLNVVAGWNVYEYQQMGMWRGKEHYDQRYEYTGEFVQIVKELWDKGSCTFKGKFFDIQDCRCLPTPANKIQIVSAGQSPAGIEFTARYADYNFIAAPPAAMKSIVERTQAAAKERGRKVGSLAYIIVVARETDAIAEEEVRVLMENADTDAIKNLVNAASLDPGKGGTSERMLAGFNQSARDGHLAFNSAPVFYGSYQSVAEQIDQIAAMGLEGALLVFPDYVPDLRSFGEKVLPLLKCR